MGDNQIGEVLDPFAQGIEQSGGFFLQALDGFGDGIGQFFGVGQGDCGGGRICECGWVSLKIEGDPVVAIGRVAEDLQAEVGEERDGGNCDSEFAFEGEGVLSDASVALDLEDAVGREFQRGQRPDAIVPSEACFRGFEGDEPEL